ALLAASQQPVEEKDQELYDEAMTEVRSYLDNLTFDQAWAAGQALPLQQVIDEAFILADKAKTTDPRGPCSTYPADLTAREVEVLRLVAQGLTNAQVAIKLVISPGTVNAHLTSLYSKLNTSSRAAATRFAVEHGLV